MRLPFADQAVIADEKLRGYLLSADHPVGAAKARIFAAVGYHEADWRLLEHDLKRLAATSEADDLGFGKYGQMFGVRGILQGPNGASLSIMTIWIVRYGEQFPRLVTAYPGRSG